MSRLARFATPIAIAGALAVPALTVAASAVASQVKSPAVKVLACNGATVSRPSNFVISCADANAALTKTRWSTWNARGATGTTRFAINLCTPYCAASPLSYFPKSTVRLSAPIATKQGRLFSKLVVRYTYRGKLTSFSFSWSGDPSFRN